MAEILRQHPPALFVSQYCQGIDEIARFDRIVFPFEIRFELWNIGGVSNAGQDPSGYAPRRAVAAD